MIVKPVKLGAFSGINNVAKGEHLSPEELSGAFNFDLTNSKSLRRRLGRRSIYQGALHSLFSDGEYIYFRTGETLVRYNTDDDTYSTMRSSIVSVNRMSYLTIDGKLYYTDGVVTGVIDGGADRSWGLQPPEAPTVVTTVGDLQPGTYMLSMTYARADGQESGSSQPLMVTASAGGIYVSSIPQSSDSGVAYIIFYLSPPNAKTMYRFTVLQHGTTSLAIRGGNVGGGQVLQTFALGAPLAGQALDLYNGRIYIAAGDTLWYTNPHQYEHIDYRFNYLPLDSRVTMVRGIDSGMWVGTASGCHFLYGDGPLSEQNPLVVRYSYSYPAIEGTSCVSDGKLFGNGEINGKVAVWASRKGVCVGTNDGILLNATEKRFLPRDVATGVATMAEGADCNQYLFALNVGPDGGSPRLPQFRT